LELCASVNPEPFFRTDLHSPFRRLPFLKYLFSNLQTYKKTLERLRQQKVAHADIGASAASQKHEKQIAQLKDEYATLTVKHEKLQLSLAQSSTALGSKKDNLSRDLNAVHFKLDKLGRRSSAAALFRWSQILTQRSLAGSLASWLRKACRAGLEEDLTSNTDVRCKRRKRCLKSAWQCASQD
jgi:hypothetical protein